MADAIPSTNKTLALNKALELLQAIGRGHGNVTLTAIAAELALPLSTAHRLAATLEAQGFILREKRGYYHLGLRLLSLAAEADFNTILARVSRPFLRELAKTTRQTVHLGVFEGDMVTYLVKQGGRKVFTQSGMQLEAYCTGIGKCLLANLPRAEAEHYLSGGPFIRLTPTTITEPDDLRRELQIINKRGYAIDDAEMDENLKCIALPLHDDKGRVRAALSVTSPFGDYNESFEKAALAALKATAAELEARLFGASG
jgi:IclR family acetate operon transcriptional repressor